MDAQEKNIYSAVIITCFVLGVILTYFFISIIRQQRKNLQLQKQNIIAGISAIEQDRARIAANLHDEMGPLLAAIKMKINSFELNDEDDQEQLIKTNSHIDAALKRVREISFDLMPNTLLRKGLIIAVEEFINYNTNKTRLKIELHTAGVFELSEQKTINMYRIIQEIIYNTMKHAQATKLTINIKREKDGLLFSSSDNGIGFDYHHELKENIGFGLRNIVSRVQMIGGHISLESKKGSGTTYIFEIPL